MGFDSPGFNSPRLAAYSGLDLPPIAATVAASSSSSSSTWTRSTTTAEERAGPPPDPTTASPHLALAWGEVLGSVGGRGPAGGCVGPGLCECFLPDGGAPVAESRLHP